MPHTPSPHQSPLVPLSCGTLMGAAALLCASAASAQQHPPERPASSWSAGFFASLESSPYQGADDKHRLLPVLAFENTYVRWAGPVLDVKLPSSGSVSYALRARYTDAGYEASDSATLAGMAERKSSVWLGARADWRHPIGHLSAEWLADAANHSSGQQIRLVAEKPLRLGPLGLAPRLALVWQDRDYVDYYFGVTNSEATAVRTTYAPKSTVSTELGLRAFYALDQQQSVFMDLHITALGAAIKDSPLVDRNTVAGLRLGYAYRF